MFPLPEWQNGGGPIGPPPPTRCTAPITATRPRRVKTPRSLATYACQPATRAKPAAVRNRCDEPVIALVDDDRNILTSVSIALQQEGFVTRVYSDPARGAEGDHRQSARPWRVRHQDARHGRDGAAPPPARDAARFRSSSSPPRTTSWTRRWASRWAPTTISPSPSRQRLLIARIRAILRRQELARGEANPAARRPSRAPLIERGRLVMDPDRHKVRWDGQEVSLTVTEFLILDALAQRPGVVKNRNQLLDVAYSEDVYVDDRTIDSHIKRIRRKFRARRPRIRRHRNPLRRRLPIRRVRTRPTSR